MLYLGTHNSGTSGKLVWWQRIFSPIFNLVSKCQDLTISEQLDMGVKVFNLQVTLYRDEWHFSHGLCIYEEKLLDALSLLKKYAKPDCKIFFQLYLDKNFFLGQDKEKFEKLLVDLRREYTDGDVLMISSWIEGKTSNPVRYVGTPLPLVEHYWTLSWADIFSDGVLDKLPLPKYHAKKYNSTYKKVYKDFDGYLMLDFFEK